MLIIYTKWFNYIKQHWVDKFKIKNMKVNLQNIENLHSSIPETWEVDGIRTDCYNTLIEKHFEDGWRDYVEPELQVNEKLGAKYYDIINGVVTSYVDVKTEEEIQTEIDAEIQQKKIQQYQELKQTDWYFIRQLETGIEIPAEVLEQRQAIRDKYNN